ncbi:hypothetical protein A0H76_2409 [Hepatospora eriocheir]|uniref:Uncharacterized protein n=1 Tax=Hepatospora eriocheir TaxID=1081669 RepID=A0A1X0QFA2_9MICR|nr:hypothetical protein A0H76_2409 [Hepatospora eriocheir]
MVEEGEIYLPFDEAFEVFKTLIQQYDYYKPQYNTHSTAGFNNSPRKPTKPDLTNRTFSFNNSLDFFKNLSNQQSNNNNKTSHSHDSTDNNKVEITHSNNNTHSIY